jgi:type II secretory pathway pseudopilin PulG
MFYRILLHSPGERTRAFSLIELLVVIGTIALLAGLFLPSLGRANSSALATACLSNLHQIGLAVELYIQDNDQRLPVCAQLPSLNTNLTPITIALEPFLQVSNIFRCPADRKTFTEEGTSYEWNIFVNGASHERPEDDVSPVTQSVVDSIFGGAPQHPLVGRCLGLSWCWQRLDRQERTVFRRSG